MNYEMIARLVKASGVSAGELILIHFWGENEDKAIADRFAAAVAALGATPVLLQQARTINREIFAAAKDSCFDTRYFDLFSGFDAVLDVFAYQPIILGYELEEKQMDLYRRYILQLYKRLEAGSLSWPRTSEEAADLTEEQFRYLMMGLNPLNPKVKEVTPKSPV